MTGCSRAGACAEAVSDAAWLRAMLAAEAALAQARGQGELGATRSPAPRELDPRELGERAARERQPGRAARRGAARRVAGPEVHRGATSQDILDTALMLVARDALGRSLLEDLGGAADAAARLARSTARRRSSAAR